MTLARIDTLTTMMPASRLAHHSLSSSSLFARGIYLPSAAGSDSPITSHYQMIAMSDKDYICSKERENGIHSCSNLPPYKMPSDGRTCHEDLDPDISFFNQTFNETHCVNWNKYYTHCRAGQF